MDALQLLKEDHDKMKKLLGEGESTTERAEKTRADLLRRIVEELTVHERIEEEIFYPALKEHPKAKEVVLEGYEEHHVADVLLDELLDMPEDTDEWHAKVKVLQENIEHHIEEEEGEMFKAARKVLDREELEQLGERMEAVKAAARP